MQKRPFANLTEGQKNALCGLLIVLGIAVIYYFQWALYLTSVENSKVNIDDPSRYFWWANDARGYRDTGDWLFGHSDRLGILARPWLYPLLLGLARFTLGGRAETALWLFQFGLWLATGALIYLTLQRAARSAPLSMIGAMLFFSHPSPLLLTFHGMTESLNTFLIAVLCWVMTSAHRHRLLHGIALLSLLTVTKPIYQIPLALLIVYYLARNAADQPRLQRLGWTALALIPILIQVGLVYSVSHRFGFSGIGGFTFKNYLVAGVYQRVEGTEWRATTDLIKDWDLRQQLDYLWAHKRQTILTFRANIIDNSLWRGSFFALGEGNSITEFSKAASSIWLYVHVLMAPLMIYLILTYKEEALSMLYFLFILQALLNGISSGQEDRLIIPLLPVWIVAYLLSLRKLAAPAPSVSVA